EVRKGVRPGVAGVRGVGKRAVWVEVERAMGRAGGEDRRQRIAVGIAVVSNTPGAAAVSGVSCVMGYTSSRATGGVSTDWIGARPLNSEVSPASVAVAVSRPPAGVPGGSWNVKRR